ncbi:hypothetical protein BDV96DRAFT_355698 [Lophiotrema nucula]|uniref:Uncharacterized protein n=1 Tax=Lophiotrema nucula TaxID=690887 RepID=A0A6A5YFJ1_9PLEO|nr:hypothetical protein BDV96DRAFT_355698 [Lophiotrema nucula]
MIPTSLSRTLQFGLHSHVRSSRAWARAPSSETPTRLHILHISATFASSIFAILSIESSQFPNYDSLAACAVDAQSRRPKIILHYAAPVLNPHHSFLNHLSGAQYRIVRPEDQCEQAWRRILPCTTVHDRTHCLRYPADRYVLQRTARVQKSLPVSNAQCGGRWRGGSQNYKRAKLWMGSSETFKFDGFLGDRYARLKRANLESPKH